MSTYETAETKYITVDSINYAYRLFGASTGIPLLMQIHFRGNMDWWDPALINRLAAHRPILLIDNAGIGRSGGTVPPSYLGWARVSISVVKALGIPKIDSFGFSMGGFVALLITLEEPALVRKTIIAGSGPSAGEGIVGGAPEYFMEIASGHTADEHRAAMLHTFFSWSEHKQALGAAWWDRMTSSRSDRVPLLEGDGLAAQIACVQRFFSGEHREEGSYDRLSEVKGPVLIANGSNDLLVPTVNSWTLFNKLVNAQPHLHLYPDSSHGFLNEYHEQFSKLVNDFLDE